MKPEPTSDSDMNDDLWSEYTFDYRKAHPNRFAPQQAPIDERVVVVLDPDVARVFTTPEEVNAILRALIENMPEPAKNAA